MHTSSGAALPRPGPKLLELTLTDEERDTLERWTRRTNSSQALALRARIVLACAGPDVPAIVAAARDLGVAPDRA